MKDLIIRTARRLAVAVVTGGMTLHAAAAPTGVPPVRLLTEAEVATVMGLPALTVAQMNLKLAALSRAAAHAKGAPQLAVQRKAGSDAAVYSGLPVATATLLPAGSTTAQLADFAAVGDLAQSWATMTAAGVPHLFVWAYGDFNAEATASWHATVTVPADASRQVYLRVAVPPVVVSGDTETGGRHRWRSRLRIELLVNGFPAWSAEATRLRSEWIGSTTIENVSLVQFGSRLDFPTDDEDTSTANDSTDIPLRNQPTPGQILHLALGRHAAGSVLNLAWVVRGTAWSEPLVPGGTDHRCNYSTVHGRWFCSRANLSVVGSGTDGPQLRFGP